MMSQIAVCSTAHWDYQRKKHIERALSSDGFPSQRASDAENVFLVHQSCNANKILNGIWLFTRVIAADSLPFGMLIAYDLQQYIYSIDENMYTERYDYDLEFMAWE